MFMNSGKLNILILVDLSVKLPSILVACCVHLQLQIFSICWSP